MSPRLQYWEDVFRRCGALWNHDGNMRRPHALLTSGMHSDSFCNMSNLIQHPSMLGMACLDLLEEAENLGMREHVSRANTIFGSALGAITISYEFARKLKLAHGFTEVVETYSENTMELKRFNVFPDTQVLVVEDVLTTGKTTRATIRTLETSRASVLPVIFVLVNRSGMEDLDGRRIVSLANKEVRAWPHSECPMCAQGSEALRPKENWTKLNADY